MPDDTQHLPTHMFYDKEVFHVPVDDIYRICDIQRKYFVLPIREYMRCKYDRPFILLYLNVLPSVMHRAHRSVSTQFSRFLFCYPRKNAQVVTNQQQTCSNAVPTTCHQDVFALLIPSLLTSCWQHATRLLSSTDFLQVVPTTCYRSAIQQVVSDNLVAT